MSLQANSAQTRPRGRETYSSAVVPPRSSLTQEINPSRGTHVIWEADSTNVMFGGFFDLVLCSPPYFHPLNSSYDHGATPTTFDLEEFVEWTAQIMLKAARAMKPNRPLCFVKTNVKYKRTLLPVGFRIADRCERLGLRLQAHWIWQRLPSFSPYAPSIANIFVHGDSHSNWLRRPALFTSSDGRSRKFPSSFTPDLFEQLIRQLTRRNSVVLDPFVGLGSVVLAASRSGRWSVGVEISRNQIIRAKAILADVPALEFLPAPAGADE